MHLRTQQVTMIILRKYNSISQIFGKYEDSFLLPMQSALAKFYLKGWDMVDLAKAVPLKEPRGMKIPTEDDDPDYQSRTNR